MAEPAEPRPLDEFDPYDPEVIESPWQFFAALRREAPLYEMPDNAYYVISRYEDVKRAAMDIQTFSSNLIDVLAQQDSDATPKFLDTTKSVDSDPDAVEVVDALAVADPPQHTRQRRVSRRAFSMRRIQQIESDIRRLVDGLIDQFIDRGRCEWMEALAVPLPMIMIVRLLGLPERDIARLKVWSDHSIALLSGVNSAEEMAEHGVEIADLVTYLNNQVGNIQEHDGNGLISDLLREAEADSESLSRSEIVSMLIQLLTAGNESTTGLIGSAMRLMLETPGLQQQLRDDPDRIEPFIEEALRLESPFHGHFRLVMKDTAIGGRHLPAGSRVMLLWSSANRDEERFADGDTVDLRRDDIRGHFAFGHGIHLCIGAALARAEARIALKAFLERTHNIRLSPGNRFPYVKSLMVRTPTELNIEFE